MDALQQLKQRISALTVEARRKAPTHGVQEWDWLLESLAALLGEPPQPARDPWVVKIAAAFVALSVPTQTKEPRAELKAHERVCDQCVDGMLCSEGARLLSEAHRVPTQTDPETHTHREPKTKTI